MNVKRISILAFCIVLMLGVDAQVLKKAGKTAEQKVNQRSDQIIEGAMDRGLDKIEAILTGKKKERNAQPSSAPPEGDPSSEVEAGSNSERGASPSEETETVLFSQDVDSETGDDFPSGWQTNGSGAMVPLEGLEGKWLRIPHNTISYPDLNTRLPENFSITFDLVFPESGQRPPVTFGFTAIKDPVKISIQHQPIFYFIIPASVKQWAGYSTSLYSGREKMAAWPVDQMAGTSIGVTIRVAGSRIQLFLNDQKIFDLPRGFDHPGYRNNFHFRSAPIIPDARDGFYIRNLQIAEMRADLGLRSPNPIATDLESAIFLTTKIGTRNPL